MMVTMPPYVLQQRLSKAIVLVRNPMPVVVSRFRDIVGKDELTNRNGLLEWCRAIDQEAMKFDSFKIMVTRRNVGHILEKVPCFSEFIRFTEWYNNLNKFIMGMDHHVVTFESLTKDLEVSVERLLEFVDVPIVMPPNEAFFSRTSNQYKWFLDEEIPFIGELIHKVASEDTWLMVSDHFRGFVAAADE